MGQGRGQITEDGCPVEVYRKLVGRGEAEFVSNVMQPAASVLDLGAGTGRIADALAALGHSVVAVDNSVEMLAAVQAAETVLADIETYRDRRRFDGVLLASHLVHTPNAELRRALLTTIAHHLDTDGTAFIEWHRPEWFDGLIPGQTYSGTIGAIDSTLHVRSASDHQLTATVSYEVDGEQWTQSFTAQRLTVTELVHDLHRVGLTLIDDEPLRGDWVLARLGTV